MQWKRVPDPQLDGEDSASETQEHKGNKVTPRWAHRRFYGSKISSLRKFGEQAKGRSQHNTIRTSAGFSDQATCKLKYLKVVHSGICWILCRMRPAPPDLGSPRDCRFRTGGSNVHHVKQQRAGKLAGGVRRPGKFLRCLEYPHCRAPFEQLARPPDQNTFQTSPRETLRGAAFIHHLCKALVSIIEAAAAGVSRRDLGASCSPSARCFPPSSRRAEP